MLHYRHVEIFIRSQIFEFLFMYFLNFRNFPVVRYKEKILAKIIKQQQK